MWIIIFRQTFRCCILAAAFLITTSEALKYPFAKFKFKCSAGMLCVEENLCDQYGVISPSTVLLTPDEEEYRMPLLPCKKKEGGTGVCCRDPNYKDDWPSSPGPIITTTPKLIITTPKIITTTPKIITTTPTTPRPPPPPPPIGPTEVLAATGCPFRRRVSYHFCKNCTRS